MSTHQPSAPVSQHRQAVTVWLAVLPTLTVLQLVLGDVLAAVPPYLRPPIMATIAVPIVVYALMPRLARLTARGAGVSATAPSLPEWPARTIAVLATVDDGPHAIPVSAPVRAGDHTILLGLHRCRDSLARLRRQPQVALLVLAEGNVAFTARGSARIAAEPMADAPDHAAVAIDVTELDDHRQPAFTVEAGVDRAWVDETEREALGRRVQALRGLAARHP